MRRRIAILLLALISTVAGAQQPAAKPAPAPAEAPVRFHHASLFVIRRSLGPFTAQQRAQAIELRLNEATEQHGFARMKVSVEDHPDRTDVLLNDVVITTVSPADAEAAGKSRTALALFEADAIRQALESFRYSMTPEQLLLSVVYTLLITAVLALLLWLFARYFPRFYDRLRAWEKKVPAIRIQNVEIVSSERIVFFAVHGLRVLRWVLTALLLYLYLASVLSLFPWTRGLAPILLSYLLTPLEHVGQAILDYIPNLLVLAAAAIFAIIILRFARLVFDELGRGTIRFAGFYPEWAEPTYKIVRVLILAIFIVVVFPYLPGSESPAFKGISIFLGVLFSLGSTSAMANVVSGIILTYTRAFQPGDRVRIAEHTGDIIERTLLITRIRTIKNEEITIPNSIVMSSAVVNYTNASRDSGLILFTSVTIGYDSPWRVIHQLLLSAAAEVEGIEASPAPFVLQKALNDFYVEYQINAFTRQPHRMAELYSALHEKIQDKFNEAGMEIMSPHYSSLRDGNTIAIPEQYRAQGYRRPGFSVEIQNDETTGGKD